MLTGIIWTWKSGGNVKVIKKKNNRRYVKTIML